MTRRAECHGLARGYLMPTTGVPPNMKEKIKEELKKLGKL